MKRSLLLLPVAAVMLATSFAGGVSAASLITSSQIKDGTITGVDVHDGSLSGADVRSSSIPPGDLTVHPRTFKWTAFYATDGVSTTARLTSTQTVPASSLVRAVGFTYTPGTACVLHGDAAHPASNTGQVVVQVSPVGSPSLVSFAGATTGVNAVHFPASTTLGNEEFTGSTAPHLQVRARCIDFTGHVANAPTPTFTVAVTFQVTAVSSAGAVAFH